MRLSNEELTGEVRAEAVPALDDAFAVPQDRVVRRAGADFNPFGYVGGTEVSAAFGVVADEVPASAAPVAPDAFAPENAAAEPVAEATAPAEAAGADTAATSARRYQATRRQQLAAWDPLPSRDAVTFAAAALRAGYNSGMTRDLEYRRAALLRLRAWLHDHEEEVLDALTQDLGKAPFEGYATELGLVYDEIKVQLRHMGAWSRTRRVWSPIVHFPSSSRVYKEPLGAVLIMSPWNYPLQLALIPLVDAIAAGNCAAVKPSRTSKATNALLETLIAECFDANHVRFFPGSARMNDYLLDERWDLLFFTGSPRVGHIVMEAAAKYLTPCVLELGGKSPCIVDATANVKRAAQRIAWGKGINCGQTCVAPDYFLVHEDVVDRFVLELHTAFSKQFGRNVLGNPEWPHMVNRAHYDRVMGLIREHGPQATIVFGGHGDPETLRIQPTCMRDVTLDDPVMQEEIFGPVIPIITYSDLEEAFDVIRCFEKPLACYVFSQSKAVQQEVLTRVTSGGATVNDVVIHLANPHMGFGGIGNSGMGAYHGKVGFDTFSHSKSTMKKGTWLELPVRTAPFGNKIELLRKLMK